MKNSILFLALTLTLTLGILRLTTRPADSSAANRTPGTAKTSLTIAARVDDFTEWADPSPIIFETDWSGPINKVNQIQTAIKTVILYANTDAALSARPGLNNGILTQGSFTLHTAYKLTGPLASPDQRFKPAPEFFSPLNLYTLNHVAGTGAYAMQLEIQMSSPSASAPEPGLYTCGLTLTAGW